MSPVISDELAPDRSTFQGYRGRYLIMPRNMRGKRSIYLGITLQSTLRASKSSFE